MYKKASVLLLTVLVIGLLTGCTKVIELSDKDNKAIAEYASELLLKYDSNYYSKYNEVKYNNSEEDTILDTEEVSTQDTEEATEVTEENSEEDITTEESSTENITEDITEGGGDSLPPEVSGNSTDIAKITGIDGASIVFDKYLIVSKYPAIDEDGAFIYLEAPEGKKLLVLKFNVVNNTSSPLAVNLLDLDIDYKIVLNETKAAKPMLTILMDDLSTYEGVIAPNNKNDAVLVFQISDSLVDNINSLILKVNYSNKENIIKIV